MDSEKNGMTDSDGNELGKIFVGGLAQETDNVALRDYFKRFGEVEEAVVMMDNRTKRSRGFGYVKFNSHEAVSFVLNQGRHVLNGKEVDAKHCNVNMKGRNRRSLKVFLGGIAPESNEEDIRRAMSEYGTVTDVNLMMDPSKQRHRGFAYVGFTCDSVVKQLIGLHFVNVGSKQVEVKAMEPPRFGARPPVFPPPPHPAMPGRGRPGRMPGPPPHGPPGHSGDWGRSHGSSWRPSQPWSGPQPWSQQAPPPWAQPWQGGSGGGSSHPPGRSWEPPAPPSWGPPQWGGGHQASGNSWDGPSGPGPSGSASAQAPGQWNGGPGWSMESSRSQAPPHFAPSYHQNGPEWRTNGGPGAPPPGHGYHPYKRS